MQKSVFVRLAVCKERTGKKSSLRREEKAILKWVMQCESDSEV